MPDYSRRDFDPPAPVAEVSVVNPADGAECAGVAMLLDTGADVSVVPRSIVERVGATRYEVVGLMWSRHPA